MRCYGSLAQLGEHLPYKQRVTGSSPVVPTIMARQFSWLERQPVTLEVVSSSLIRVATVMLLQLSRQSRGLKIPVSLVRFRPEAPNVCFAGASDGEKPQGTFSVLHIQFNADLAHLVERHLAKVEVASSSLVIRSRSTGVIPLVLHESRRNFGIFYFSDINPHKAQRWSLCGFTIYKFEKNGIIVKGFFEKVRFL